MSALDWRKQMKEAPRLIHGSDGLVLIQLGEHSVLFPTEADARFFYSAYTDVPSLEARVAELRTQIDEDAFLKTHGRVKALEAEVEALRRRQGELETQLAAAAEKGATGVNRARVLTLALKRVL